MAVEGAEAAGKPPRVLGTVVAASGIALLIQLALDPPADALALLARFIGFPVAAALAFLFGRWLGTRTWPKRGRRMARYMLRRALREEKAHLLFVCDRPDFPRSLARRVVEVVGFSAGAAVIIASVLVVIGFEAASATALAGTFTLITLWLSFVLVPYWLFGRMGLRQVDAVRWLVLPMSRRYADRLRLSNGALLLIALGATFNLLYRAGLSQDEALIQGVVALAQLVASVLVVAATGVAYYFRDEHAHARLFEEEALAMGIRDGRGMTDGEFLPRLPAARPRADAPPLMEHHVLRPGAGAAKPEDELKARP